MTTIKLKNGSGAPAASDLVQGEPALDLTNKRLYSEDASGNVIEVGTNPTTLTVTGNVGIGTTSPSDLLHIKSTSADAEISLESTNSGGDARIRLIGNSSGSSTVQFQDEGDSNIGFISYLHSDNAMTFRTNDSERMRIDSSGNVGIGATSLSNKLTVNGNQVLLAGGEMKFADAGNSLVSVIKNGGSSGTSQMQFLVGSTPAEVMRITSAGRIGIGTDAPSYVFDVANNASETARFRFRSTVSGETAAIRLQVADGTSNATLEFGDSSDGDAGRITYGHSANIMRFYTSANERMRLENDGDLQVEGSVVGSSSVVSDERFKDDVTTITGALDTVDSLRGVTFTWNAGKNTGDTDYGFIAQEVEQVIPEIVHDKKLPLFSGDEDTVYKTVDYVKVCAVLVEAVSELRAEVQTLKDKVAALEGA